VSAPLRLEFLQSAAEVNQLPDSLTEVAFVGRSNVGKSSLINALANRKKLARTSKTPGATRLINVYELQPADSGRWLVDLPGYGYANVPNHERERWAAMIEAYLTHSETLDQVLLLIDGAVGPTALDLQTSDWLTSIGVEFRLIATKADKVKASTSKKRRTELSSKLGVAKGKVHWVSANSGLGIGELRSELAQLLSRTISDDEPAPEGS